MNEQHQLDVWTTALDFPDYEVVFTELRKDVRHFSLVPLSCLGVCPDCGDLCDAVHQKRWIEQVTDLPLCGQQVELKVRVVQFRCHRCERCFTPDCPLLTPGMGAKGTARLIAKAAELIQKADIKSVAEFYSIPRKTLARWYYEWVEQTRETEPAEPIRSIGIDELALKKKTVSNSSR